MFLNESEIKRFTEAFKRVWARSFWPLLALLCGLILGVLVATNRIIDDCKYAGAFRVDSQAFHCQRKI